MTILLMDGFRGYPTINEMLKEMGRGGPWERFNGSNANYQSLINNATWRADSSSLRGLVSDYADDKFSPQRDFTAVPVKSVCAQFICGQTGGNKSQTEACNFVIFQEPATDITKISTTNLRTFYGVSIRSKSATVGSINQVGVYYTILTGVNGAVNEALIGYLKPWTRDRHYHVELKVDHTNPVAKIVVYVNGVLEMDTTYDRDRIDSGFQTKDFKRVLLGGGDSGYRPPIYSNLVIYTDESGTSFPMGPIDVITVSPTAGQGYDGLRATPNADDATYTTVNPGASLSGTFDDLVANTNPVLAVDATIRHGSTSGLEPSQITATIKKADAAVIASMVTTAAPGVPPTHKRVRLPAGLTAADVNGMTFTIQAAG